MMKRAQGSGKILLIAVLSLLVFGVGCAKKPAPAPAPAPPPPPPPARPTVTLQASAATIQRGESSTLTWSSTNATELALDPGIGTVAPEGSTKVTPSDSTTYTITAKGPGGSETATVRITVNVPPPPPPPPPQPTIEELFARDVRDAFFDYDKADIRADARDALTRTAEFLRGHPEVNVAVEGHCDERGSTEYNLALGDRRAQAVRQFLISLGIASDRMNTVSYGKERPVCTESNEECWQRNRRGHFVMAH